MFIDKLLSQDQITPLLENQNRNISTILSLSCKLYHLTKLCLTKVYSMKSNRFNKKVGKRVLRTFCFNGKNVLFYIPSGKKYQSANQHFFPHSIVEWEDLNSKKKEKRKRS